MRASSLLNALTLGGLLALSVPLGTAGNAHRFQTLPFLPGFNGTQIETAESPDWVLANPAQDLVYARDADTIAVVDGPSNMVSRHFDLGRPPEFAALDAAHGRLYVSHPAHRAVSVVDTFREVLIDTLLFVEFQPTRLAVDADHQELYVLGPSRVAVVDVRDDRRTILRTIELPGPATLLEADPAAHRVFAAVSDPRGLALLDPVRGRLLYTVPLPPGGPMDLAVNPATGLAYVSTLNLNSVVALDVSHPPHGQEVPIVADVNLGEQTWSVEVEPRHNRIYVLEHQGPAPGTLWILNATTHVLEDRVELTVDGTNNPNLMYCWDSHFLSVNGVTERAYASCPIGSARHVAIIRCDEAADPHLDCPLGA